MPLETWERRLELLPLAPDFMLKRFQRIRLGDNRNDCDWGKGDRSDSDQGLIEKIRIRSWGQNQIHTKTDN